MEIKPWKTALKRKKLSRPMNFYIDQLNGSILDYGCGYGDDVKILKSMGYNIVGYDKYLSSNENMSAIYDTITCNYMFNVIPDYDERLEALNNINNLLHNDGVLFVSVRYPSEQKSIKSSVEYNDGLVTSIDTFQKFFTTEELIAFVSKVFPNIESILDDPIIIKVKKH